MAITRSQDRINKTGEVFTPPNIVKEMLDALPPESFIDPLKTFLDPAAGDGNFLVAILARKIANGHNPLKALQTCYGVELMADNVAECKQRLKAITLNAIPKAKHTPKVLKLIDKILDNNIVCHDSLTWDYENWKPVTA